MVYLQYFPEFTPVDYIKALENKLGKSCVVQLAKASGQVLDPEALLPGGLYCPCREFFRRLHLAGLKKDGIHPHEQREKITDLPKKIVMTAKGGSALAYLEYGFRCFKCYRMGHKRMNCPRIISIWRQRIRPRLIFSSGVQVIGQRVLSPGKIASFDVTIQGMKETFINCHFSHAPDERLQQLQAITAAAVNDDAWVLGDLNISEESASDIASGSVEALGELLDRANLVDVSAIFDAAHLPTKIFSCGSRVDASRLDRVLLPSRLSNRVTRYWSLYYKNSDHRAVLLQIGEAPEPRPPCIASMLRSRRIWPPPSSPSTTCVATTTTTSRGQEFVQIKLEDVSTNSDYPSLPDLGRALRLRCRGPSSTTFYDSAGRVITGPAVRDLAFANLKESFSHPSCSPEDIDGFLLGFTLRATIEESDLLHRYGIGEEEIVTAIGRLPTGKAAGWDDLPCELFRGFEDFFASALCRVFEVSQLCGALPSSMRRSEMSLIAKTHGGLGLAGLRPLFANDGLQSPERSPLLATATSSPGHQASDVRSSLRQSAASLRGVGSSALRCTAHYPAAGTVAPSRQHPLLHQLIFSPAMRLLGAQCRRCRAAGPARPSQSSTSGLSPGADQAVFVEAFIIIQQPPDLQRWIFGHDLEDDTLAIMASAKTRIYKHFLGLEMRGVQEDPLLENQLIERQDVIFPKVGGSKKRPHYPDHAKPATKKGCVQALGIPLNSRRPPVTPRPSKWNECQTTRQKQTTFRVRSAAGQAGQCVYLKFCPDFTQEELFRALETKLEEGLNIKDVTLRAFPLGKRAERIVLGNVLFFVEAADLVTALRPYGQVTSIIQKMMQLEDSCWANARREAFITLRDGVKPFQIPARLGVKQGHKRVNCPRKTGLQEVKLVLPVDAPATRTQGWTRPPSTSNTVPSAALTPAASAALPADHTPAAVDTAPLPSRSSNAQQEDLTPKKIPIRAL
ncbi:hypothetical protein LAZ67_14001719 [Cordylochernes scorpioides]|uniref:CCHC-type domain-containing protein n=1 Tax=Cordylochernes scorpioides TaxID=51811 RepID=A0ABY6L9T5_9ARAC|nr:hypothetical protein LAZ67_14001719 [Cordylochernes scorpioides]